MQQHRTNGSKPRARSVIKRRVYFRPLLEPLEARALLSAVTWTIDPTQSSFEFNVNPITAPPGAVFAGSPGYINGDIDLGLALGFQAQLGLRNEGSDSTWGTNPDPGGFPPGNFAALSGTIGTNYVDGSSIQFLGGASNNISALNGGAYAPRTSDWVPSIPDPPFNGAGGFSALNFAPSVFGVEAYIPQVPGPAAFVSEQNVLLDLQSGTLAINGLGQFAANTSSVGMKQTDFALQSLTNQQNGITDSYSTGVSTAAALVGPNAVSLATITNLGGNLRQLTYQFELTAFLPFGSIGDVPLDFPLIESGTIVATTTLPPSTVVARNIFYSGSARYDQPGGTNGRPPSTFSDDNAIATDKVAYIANGTASTFANVISYDKGINGIMVDLSAGQVHTGMSVGTITNDFAFKVGNNNSPSTWPTNTVLPTTVTVRAGAGVSGSDRVELIWPSGSIKEKWLEVTVLSTGAGSAHTGLANNDVFFFGDAVADSGGGDTATLSETTSVDELGARNNAKTLLNNIPITNVFDYNRDGLVSSIDSLLARNNPQTLGATKYINISGGGPFAPLPPSGDGVVDSGEVSVANADIGIASGLASTATSQTPTSPPIPVWIGNRLSHIDLNSGPIAKYFEHLAQADIARDRAILVSADQLADSLGPNDELLDSLVVRLGLE